MGFLSDAFSNIRNIYMAQQSGQAGSPAVNAGGITGQPISPQAIAQNAPIGNTFQTQAPSTLSFTQKFNPNGGGGMGSWVGALANYMNKMNEDKYKGY